MGVSQITDPEKIYQWQSRQDLPAAYYRGGKTIFLRRLQRMARPFAIQFRRRQNRCPPPKRQEALVTVTNQTNARVLNSQFGIQSVNAEVEAAEPSLVVVAQTYYHDWRAFVDGHETTVLRANYAFQAIQVPAGRHQIRLVYKDRAFEIGAAVSIIAWLGCVICLFRPSKRKIQ